MQHSHICVQRVRAVDPGAGASTPALRFQGQFESTSPTLLIPHSNWAILIGPRNLDV